MLTSHVTAPVAGGEMPVHVTGVTTGGAPVVLLLTPIFGVTSGIEQLAARIAAAGYTVLAPDMFWRVAPGPLAYEGADREKAQQRYRDFDVEQGIADVGTLVGWAKAEMGARAVGVVGLCFGGRYALTASTRYGADAAISYHGTYLERHLDEFANIRKPVSLHFGEDDPHTPMDVVASMKQAGGSNPMLEIYTYAGAGHGFMQQDRASFNATAAELALARGMQTLKRALVTGEGS